LLLLALAELDSNTWVSEVKRIGGKKLPLTAAPFALNRGKRKLFPHSGAGP
jgi:hypothetical protein